MNGGRDASRGFYLQALISIFESVKTTSWKSILVEPNEEKVDIEITFIDDTVKVIQVKSTINNFKPSIIKKVIKSLVSANKDATEYEVVFIGEYSVGSEKMLSQSEVNNFDFLNEEVDDSKKIEIRQIPLDLDTIESNVKRTLSRYLNNLGLEANNEKLNMIHGNLIAETLLASINGSVLLKEQFNDMLRDFVNTLNEKEDEDVQKIDRILSPESKSFLRKRKIFRSIGFLLLIVFIISPIIKYFREGLSLLDIVGLIVTWIIIFATFLLFKISDKKFKNDESKENDEYSRNNNEAQNNILKMQVSDKVEFIRGNRKVYRIIELYNLTSHRIDYIQGDIYFYQGSSRIHSQDFNTEHIDPYGSVIVYDNYLVKEKSNKYWSKFTLKISKSSRKDLEKKELHSTTEYRTYGTLLNSYYLPVIEELFFYESSWAIDKLRHHYYNVVFCFKKRTPKRMLVGSIYLILLVFAIIFVFIGIYNSLLLFWVFGLIKNLF